ncbi:MAG: hypothetical protein E6Y71_06310 [Finegoldia magna]|nr:hypothetical protein [Finegoldia magna]MDU5998364.1 hypothetical protein [Finegoldia magna]
MIDFYNELKKNTRNGDVFLNNFETIHAVTIDFDVVLVLILD